MSLEKLMKGEEDCLNCKKAENGGRKVQATEYISFVVPDKDGHMTLCAGTYCQQCGEMIEDYCNTNKFKCTRHIYYEGEVNPKEKVEFT